MTILVTSDLHFSSNPRDEYRHAFVKTLRGMVNEHRVNILMILGDLTETKDRHDAELVNRVVGHIDRLAQSVGKLILLRGNHDWLNDPEMPFFKFLGRLPNVTWINTPTDVGIGLFLPHTTDYERDWAKYIKNGFGDFTVVFCHNTFKGAIADNGAELDGIPPAIFPKDIDVISGDVHTPQEVGPVTYVGAPYHIDFGNHYDPRVLLIDEKGRVKSIPCYGPTKRLVEIKSVKELDRVKGLAKGDILKVRVTIDRSQVAEWAEIRQKVREWGEDNHYLVHVVQPVIADADRRLDTGKRRNLAKTDEELFDQYCRRMDIDDRTAKVGRDIMEEG